METRSNHLMVGAVVLALIAALLLFFVWLAGAIDRMEAYDRWAAAAAAAAASAYLTIGGLSFAAGFGGGLYWTLAGVVLGFFTSVANAWVILIEINR